MNGFQNQRWLVNFLAVWCLCGWLSISLLHDASHALAHEGEAGHSCLVCQSLHQPALEVQAVFVAPPRQLYQVVLRLDAATQGDLPPQHFPQPLIPRGPPL